MKSLDDKTKRLIMVFGGFIIFLILIIVIVSIIGNLKGSSLSYTEIENKLVEGAKNYYSSNSGALPLNDADQVEISSTLLAEEGYIKELSKYQKDKSVSCTRRVIVTKSGDNYNYSPLLDCGDKYTTTYLYEKLLENVVSKDDGLYKTTEYSDKTGTKNVYVYRGDYVDNFIKLDEHLWRIVKINDDFSIMVIEEEFNNETSYRGAWDDRYNKDKNTNNGINDYYKSIIRRNILNYYDNYFSENLKSKVVLKDICVGLITENTLKGNGKAVCSKTLNTDYASLLTVYDFMNASLDTNCKKTTDYSCSNYNYLTDYDRSFWLLNADSEKSWKGFKYSSAITSSNLSTTSSARVVINLNKNLIYSGGNGTYENPYIIK